MAKSDKTRWDERYINRPYPIEVVKIVEDFYPLVQGKDTLEIACGKGRNARFLAAQGFKIDAYDISSVAIKTLQGLENINAKEIDLDDINLGKDQYDLIVCTYYLDRSLFPKIYESLKEGGIFIFETYVYHEENENAPSQKRFLLQEGELVTQFNTLYEILHLQEKWGTNILGSKVLIGSIVGKKKVVTDTERKRL